MKYAFLFLFAVVFAAPGMANDPKPFNHMTYQELEAINTDSLSKDEKKQFKKAYKIAKKAEKKRRYEEKKRRKAQAKAREKHNKAIYKQIKIMEDSYNGSSIIRDDFEAYVRVVGQTYYDGFGGIILGLGEKPELFLRTLFYPKTGKTIVQLQVRKQYIVSEMTDANLKRIKSTPEKYATRRGYWKRYTRATLRGGLERQLEPTKRYVAGCHAAYCTFTEEFAVELKGEDLSPSLNNYQPLEVKVTPNKGNPFIATLPSLYVVGFLERLSEVDPVLAAIQPKVSAVKQALQGQLR